MNKKGFISISVIYSFLLLFVLLMLGIVYSYMTRDNLINTLVTEAKDKINGVSGETHSYTETFTYSTPNSQEWKVPYTGTYKIELWGASGGDGYYDLNGKAYNPLINSASGGKASYVSGNIYLENNETLFLFIGQQGIKFTSNSSTLAYNGGGYGFVFHTTSGQGGGATDLRIINGNWNDLASLYSKIMVAGGGGGAGESGYQGNKDYPHANGGNAGGLNGEIGGQGISMTANTIFSSQAPKSGTIFGTGGNGRDNNDCGGGGGGYYGGQGGLENSAGGGGSSYISGHKGCVAIQGSAANPSAPLTPRTGTGGVACTTGINDQLCSVHYSGKVFTNTKMIDGTGLSWTNIKGSAEAMPNPLGGTYPLNTGHIGNGYVRITYVN